MRDATTNGNGQTRRPLSVDEALATALASNTRTAYRKAFRRFEAWCAVQGVEPLGARPEQIARFLVELASTPRPPKTGNGGGRPLAMATIRVVVAAINRAYQERDREPPTADPTVLAVLRGIGRLTPARRRQVRALRAHDVARLLERLDEEAAQPARRIIATRDAAIIATGFAAALRRSEICALEVADVESVAPGRTGAGVTTPARRDRRSTAPGSTDPGSTAVPRHLTRDGPPSDPGDGMVLHIRRSKTDPYGGGHRVAVPDGELIRPVSRLQSWLRASRIRGGPLFQTLRRNGHLQGRPLHPTDIGRLVKRRVGQIGLDPTDYSGHSLRAGFVTSAAESGARIDKIMEVTRHKTPGMVLRYVRQADAFKDHAGLGFL